MKKLLSLLVIFALFIGLVACDSKDKDFEKVFQENLITYSQGEDESKVTKNITLALTSDQVKGVTIAWESNKPAVITINNKTGVGIVTPPNEDTVVELTVKVTIGDTTKTRTFNLTVLKKVVTFNVTFVYGGTINPQVVKVAEGNKVDKPADPTRDGYIFAGWFKDEAGKTPWDFATDTVTANVTLYAIWILPKDEVAPVISGAVDITLEVGSETPNWLENVSALDDVDGVVNVTITENTVNLQVVGTYKIVYEASDQAGNKATVTIKVNVVPATYDVTFVYGGGLDSEVVKVAEGNKVEKPSDPTRDGYTFNGWFKDEAGETPWDFTTDTVTGNVTIYAVWTFVEDKIAPVIRGAIDKTVEVGSEAPNWLENITAIDEIDGEVTVTIKENTVNLQVIGTYKIVYEASDQAGNKATVTISVNVVPVSYNVTFVYGGDLDSEVVKVAEGNKVEKPSDPTREGYAFAGWYKDENGETPWDFTNDTVTSNVSIYAIWTLDDKVAPFISGAFDMTFEAGSDTPNWLENVSAVDAVDGDVSVTIIENTVNLQVAGTYRIVYQAQDQAGNKATVTVTVTVTGSVPAQYTKSYEFDFANTGFGFSYSDNKNTSKNLPNVLGGTVSVVLTRTAANNNHSKYKDYFLVMSAASKKTEDDFAFIEFKFDKDITKMTFDATYWSENDATQMKKLVLQKRDGDNWVDVFDIKKALNGATSYQNIVVENLDGKNYRIYGEGVDPTSVDNGARLLIDNMMVYTGQSVPVEKKNLQNDIANLNIITTYIEPDQIVLPTTGASGSTIVWSYANADDTNNSLVNLTTKAVTMPTSGQVNVGLKATLTNGDFSDTKVFTLIIGEGEPLTLTEVKALAVGAKLKTKGIITDVYETATEIHFFIQDANGGIYVVAPIAMKDKIVSGNEITLNAVRSSNDKVVMLNNVTKVEVLGTKTFSATNVTNPTTLNQYSGKLVSISGLLTKTYTETTMKYTLITKFGTFDITIPSDLNETTKAALQEALANQEVGLQVSVTACVIKENELLLVKTNNITVDATINLSLIKEVILANITLPDVSNPINENLTLPTTTDVFPGVTIEWTSNNANAITNTGVVTRLENDTTVTLTYKIKLNTAVVEEATLTVTVRGKDSYSGYYASISGLSGNALKAELTRIISTGVKSYEYSDTSNILNKTDIDPNKPGNIILVYNRASISGTWDGGNSWNKEHIWPQSKLGNASKSDLHNLRPANPSINSSRGNDPYVDGSGSYKRTNGGWYPGDDDRGDIARAVFYMNTRWGLTINSGIGTLSTFIKWHNEDPVDDFERYRNETIYSYQKNRNPYVDHPELVAEIYDTVKLTTYGYNNKLQTVEYVITFNKNYVADISEFDKKTLYA